MSNTILHRYFREYGAMLSYAKLRDLIFNNECQISAAPVNPAAGKLASRTTINTTSTIVPTTGPTTTRASSKRASRKVSSNADKVAAITIEHSPNDMLAIHNDEYFGIVFNNFRKQKSPLAFVYYKTSTNSLNAFIKNPVGFPLIIVNIPNSISAENLFVNPAYINESTTTCYTLPLNDTKFKNSLVSKQTSYNIKYSINDGKITFSYQSYAGGSMAGKFETSSITEEPLKECFNILISDKIDPLGLLLVDDTFDALATLNNMSLNIIARQTSTDTFNTSDSSRTNNKIVIQPDGTMHFNQTGTKSGQDSTLCSQDDSVRWNTNFTNIIPNDNDAYEFELYPYTNMFKNNYIKSVMNDTRVIYYVFGQFAGEIYVLGKIIASKELLPETIRTYTFANLFDDDFSTKEIYICKTLNGFRK